MRKLAIVAVSGLGIAVVCIGAVAAIGVGGLRTGDFNFPFPLFDGPSCGRMDGDGTATSRTIAWDGADQVILSVPGQAHYAPGDDTMLHISGDPALIAHIRVRGGHIEMDCRNWHGNGEDVKITLPGLTFRKFAIAGSGQLYLDELDQKKLGVSIAGSGDIHANGRVRQLDVHIAGSGDADLGNVTTDIAKVRIAGSGNADVAPRQKADIRIAGSGNVILHANPAELDTRIAGSGHVRTAEDGI